MQKEERATQQAIEKQPETIAIKSDLPKTETTVAKNEETKTEKKSPLPWKKIVRIALLLAIVVIIAGAAYYFRGQFIVATVNGQPITRVTLIRELDKKYGQSVLDSLVTKMLVAQEGQKNHVTVSDAEVNDRIAAIEKNIVSQGSTLDEALSSANMTRDELKDQIHLQLTAEKIAGKNVTVTDKEVSDYIEQNKDSYAADANMDEVKVTVKEQLLQQKVNTAVTDWLKKTRDSAKIVSLLKF